MKNEMPDEELDALLHGWKVEAKPPSRFAAGVWRRIAQRKAESETAPWYARTERWIGGWTQRMDIAWLAAAALVAVLGAGWLGMRKTPHGVSVPDSRSYRHELRG